MRIFHLIPSPVGFASPSRVESYGYRYACNEDHERQILHEIHGIREIIGRARELVRVHRFIEYVGDVRRKNDEDSEEDEHDDKEHGVRFQEVSRYRAAEDEASGKEEYVA